MKPGPMAFDARIIRSRNRAKRSKTARFRAHSVVDSD
jgi:hypothetical protein